MPSTRRTDAPTPAGAWTAACAVIAVSLLSTFTLADGDDATDVRTGPYFTDPSGEPLDPSDTLYGMPAVDPSDPGSPLRGPGVRRNPDGSPNVPGATTTTTPSGPPGGPTTTIVRGPGGESPPGSIPPDPPSCNRGNAGATDVGVSAGEINFAATVVKTGIARDFLSDAQFGMEAVIQKVNRAGGVCKRLIKVKYDDDGWDQGTGARIIEKYIAEKKYFGLAVNPSSEGLRGPIESGLIKNNKFPVIGADGMLIGQYKDPYVWPVATSTHSTMHIMAKDAARRGAKTFGIVWEGNYRFGEEGERAFVGAVKRRGGTVVANVKIQGGLTSYKNNVNQFLNGCGSNLKKCDFIAVLLEPATAGQWVRDGGLGDGEPANRPNVGIGGPQPLFVNSFVRDCGKACANMQVWTSLKPPIPPFDQEPAVATYLSDLRNISNAADASNPHVEGAYVGMLLLVDALKKLGPAPTREGIRQVLDQTVLETGLTETLRFSPGNHFSATSAQSFEAIYNVNSFTSWRYTNSGFIKDDEVAQDQRG